MVLVDGADTHGHIYLMGHNCFLCAGRLADLGFGDIPYIEDVAFRSDLEFGNQDPRGIHSNHYCHCPGGGYSGYYGGARARDRQDCFRHAEIKYQFIDFFRQ